jgi:hypothetical protein
MDPVVNYPVGCAVGTHETPELIRKALQNAVNHTNELFGKRYMNITKFPIGLCQHAY